MFSLALTSLALAASVLADSPPSYGAPAPSYAPAVKEEAHPYTYSYAVADSQLRDLIF